MKVLNNEEIQRELTENGLQEWEIRDEQLFFSKKFADFKTAFSAIKLIAEVAEEMDHHPDWRNVYNTLEVRLSTHDAGGVTEKDIHLAIKISKICSF